MKHILRIPAVISLSFILANTIPAGMSQKRETRPQTSQPRKAHPDAAGPVFGAATSFAAGGGIGQSAAADFNGDGIPDIAVVSCNPSSCSGGSASVAVLIGNGDGSFQAPAVYATGSFQPTSVAVGDVNGDGVPDLVVASQCASSTTCGTGAVSVLLGNGDGTFQSPIPYSTGTGSSFFVVTGDFNGDGNLDLAVANQAIQPGANSAIAILLGNGDGTFQAPVSYSTGAPSAVFLAVGDFNSDGAADLAVANNGADTVSVLLGNGNGSFQAAAIYASGGAFANSLAVSDFNGDGLPDLAVVNACASYSVVTGCSQSGSVGVLLGNGDGTFQPPAAYSSGGNQANFVSVADFNGDGIPDLAVGNYAPSAGGSAGVLSLLVGTGDGTFPSSVTFGTGGNYAFSVSAADFNGDGQPGIAVVNQCDSSGNCNGAVGVLLNTVANFNLYASSISLTSSVDPTATGQAVLLTATVTPAFNTAPPTGNVTFYNGATALSTVALSGGQAAYTASFSAPGPQALQAVYSADSNYAASASAVLSETVGTPVALTSSLNPAPFQQSVTFTATVTGSGGTPTGTVTFTDGATSMGTYKLVSGSVAITRSSLAAANHSITATYNGDTNFAPGAATLTQAVSQSSAVTLSSSSNPATVNQPVTFTANVTGQYGGVPMGAVAFIFTQGSSSLTWGTAPLLNGTATIQTTFSKSGAYPIAAVYLGSAGYQGSTSAAVSQGVGGNQDVVTSTVLASSGSPSIVNQPVTFTATVSPASGAIPNGETVTFYNGSNTLGTGATANGQAVFTTSALPLGTNSITAAYSGDGTYQGSTSKAVRQDVQLNQTTTTITSSLNPSTYGQSVTFTVAVTPQSGSGTPTGTVTVRNGAGTIGTVTLGSGNTVTTAALPAGSLPITADYSGDSNFSNSTSPTLTQTVSVATTTAALSTTPNPSSLNQAVTFTATVTGQYGGTAGGNVTFTQGTTNLGNATPVRGKATINYAFPAVGTFPVTATYSGDVNNSGSVSNTVSQVVGNISTNTTLTSSGSPAFAGQTITFTATVAPASGAVPDGETVTFYDGAAAFGTGSTQKGVATLATSMLAVGNHSITAAYAGDATYQTSTSRILRQVVSLNGSVTTLVSSLNPAVYGQSVTLTATVTAASGSLTPTGKVIIKNGSAFVASVPLSSGSASYTSSTLPAGALALTASYSGDGNFSNSSMALTQVVNLAATAATLTSNPNPSALSATVTFTATVAAEYLGSVTGPVSFMNGSKTMGSAPLTRGKAVFTYAFPTAGTDSITAVYQGDANNQASTSPTLSQVVTNAPTSTAVSSSGSPAFVGQPVTFTATVSSTYGPIPDGEPVTFYDSANAIGEGGTKGGAATLSTSALTAGTHQITAMYAGDSSFESSTSRIFRQVVSQQSTTTALGSSANPSAYGQPVTLTATVTAGGPTPAGTVTFRNGTASLGIATLNSQGAATVTTLTLGAGANSITASYSGDTASAKSASPALNQTVNPASTTTQIFSSVNPAAPGQSVTFTAVVRSPTAFATGSVTFSVGNTVLGAGNLIDGSAKLQVTTLPAGASVVTATYAASANLAGSAASITEYVE
jgi:hypothetical protein